MATVVEVQDRDTLESTIARYTATVTRAVDDVTRQAADRLDAHDPQQSANVVRTLWKTKIDGLMGDLRIAYDGAVTQVRKQLDEIITSVTAAAEPYQIPDPPELLAEQYLKSRANFIENVGTDVWSAVQNELVVGMQAGEGITELRDRVRHVTDLVGWQAERIARTEVVGATNAGAYAQMQSSGVTTTKTWLARLDTRTRPSHAAANGQTVDFNEKFEVGGTLMDRPHDPSAPVAEIVQCRCTLTFNVDEEPLLEQVVERQQVETQYTAGTDLTRWVTKNFQELDDLNATTPIYLDGPLSRMTQEQGWGPPRLGTTSDFDRALERGYIELHRGVIPNNVKNVTADDIIAAMKADPEYQYGTGIYGDGIYFSTDPRVAARYARGLVDNVGVENGATTRAALNPHARVIEYEDLLVEMKKFQDDYARNPGSMPPAVPYALARDPGRFAAMRGYDAIRVVGRDDGVTKKKELATSVQYVILNRTALLMEV